MWNLMGKLLGSCQGLMHLVLMLIGLLRSLWM